jgi:hypothetical protein
MMADGSIMSDTVYPASRIKRKRATKDEMQIRARFLIDYAKAHGPVTVRGLYYQAEVAKLPGITKDDGDYDKIQRQVLELRRAGRMPYSAIADATRWMRKPRSYDGIEDALRSTAATYRKALWADANATVEIWCEKDALAGVILPVTTEYDVPLMVTRGFSSETFCFEAIEAADDDRPYFVYYLGDYDRAGQDAARSLEEKLNRFAAERGITVIFETVAVSPYDIARLGLPTREPKRNSPADRKWPHEYACELDAIPPDEMRRIVKRAIERHLPKHQLDIVKVAEASERQALRIFARAAIEGARHD